MTMAQYTPMIQQYLSIKAKHTDAFLFFRLGDFYEMFFDDAIHAARELEITLTGRDGGMEERIPMCGVPYHAAESYISQLINKGYKVAICEQVEDPKEAKGVVKREVIRVITPGTVLDGKTLQDKKNNFIVSVFHQGNEYALAACDVTTGEFYCTWLPADDDALLNELSYYQPSEIIVYSNGYHYPVGLWKEQFTAIVTGMDAANYSLQELERDGLSVFSGNDEVKQNLIGAAGILLAYLKEMQKKTLQHISNAVCYEPRQYMQLDAFTRKNLELIETVRDKSKKGSLLWLLDKTATAMGGRMLKKWIDKPLVNKPAIEQRLESVQFFVDHWLVRDELKELLQGVYDLERLAGRIAYGSATARDLVQLASSLRRIPQIKSALLLHDSSGKLREAQQLDECTDIADMIAAALVDDPPFSVKEGGMIRPGYNDYLDKLLEAGREGKKWIVELERKEKEVTGIKSLKVGYNKVFGYYIEITRANLANVPEDRYIRKQTLANAERFITPELKEKEALILEAEEKSVELEHQLFCELRDRVAYEISRIQAVAGHIAVLDVLQSLARVSQESGYIRPKLRDGGGFIRIKEGRHPVVEAMVSGESYVANDVFLDREQRQILLITGPNMAGKSTYMRQVALIVIMAQIGCYVPAAEAELSIVDRIFTRIGAADDLAGGQSTFMVEMNEIKLTTLQATPQSLVIIDELGRGTSTADGMAIAQAVIEYIHHEIGGLALVSTHYHELADLQEQLPRLRNYSMAVIEKENKVIFLRSLQEGAASKSYGIYCAQIAGVPEKIVKRAGVLLSQFENQYTMELEVAATTAAQVKKGDAEQLALFPDDTLPTHRNFANKKEFSKAEQIFNEIKKMDLMNMSPMEAMNFLYRLKQTVESGKE